MDDFTEPIIHNPTKVPTMSGECNDTNAQDLEFLVPTHPPTPPKYKPPPVPKKPEKKSNSSSCSSASSAESLNSIIFMAKSDTTTITKSDPISRSRSPSSSPSVIGVLCPSGENLPENLPLSPPTEKSSLDEITPPGIEIVQEAESKALLPDSEITANAMVVAKTMDEFGDCGQNLSQNLVEDLAESKIHVEPPSDRYNVANLELDGNGAIEAINQSPSCSKSVPTLASGIADLNHNSAANVQQQQPNLGEGIDVCNSQTGTQSLCPFLRFHNQNSNISEFLSLHKSGTSINVDGGGGSDSSIRFPLSNKKVDDTIQFIVENVKDGGGGIWPSVFLEKLIRLLVTTTDDGVKKCFHDQDFSLLTKLVDAFTKEKRCSLVYRYYCLFYNMMSRCIVPLEEIVKTKLLERLQQDFQLAASNRCRCCRCGDDNVHDPTTTTLNLLPDSEAREHLEFSPVVILGLASFLLIPIYTQLANNINFGEKLDPETEKSFSTTIIRLICDYGSDTIFQNHDRGDEDNIDPEDKITLRNTKSILAHLLISQNLCQGRTQETNAILKSVLELGWDHSQLKERLMTIFIQELIAFEQGFKDGIQAALNVHQQAPLGLQLTGLTGPIKLFNDILTLRSLPNDSNNGGDFDKDKDREGLAADAAFFNVDELTHIATTAMAILEIIGMRQTSQTRDSSDDEIQLTTRKLLSVLQQRIHHTLTQSKVVYLGPSFHPSVLLDFSTTSTDITRANSRFTTLNGSGNVQSSSLEGGGGKSNSSSLEICEEGKRSILSKSKVVALWPLERMLKWFGCSKRMASSTVGPASVRDVEYLRFSSGSGGSGGGSGGGYSEM